jgi:hypothetical protein
MGGTAANRVTSGVSGIAGSTLGGSGGSQYAQADTLTATSTVTDPGHFHTSSALGPANHDSTSFLQGATTWDLTRNQSTNSAVTGITVSTTVSTTLTGTTQNMPPTAMINWIIYLGA